MSNSDEEYDAQLHQWILSLEIPDMNLHLLATAFTHPSYKGIVPGIEDYERMEFLGDAVINLITAEQLVCTSQLTEGAMTEKRKSYVNNEFFRQVFEVLKIQPLIRTGKNHLPSPKDKANFVEAFFGARFIDKGYDQTKLLWNKLQQIMEEHLNQTKKMAILGSISENNRGKNEYQEFLDNIGLIPKNAKSLLQELCQKQNLPILTYSLLEKSGPDHDARFTMEVKGVLFKDKPEKIFAAMGYGNSKKQAEYKAAESLCEEIGLEYIPSE